MKKKRHQNVTALLGVEIKSKSKDKRDSNSKSMEEFFQNAKSHFLKQFSKIPKTQSK